MTALRSLLGSSVRSLLGGRISGGVAGITARFVGDPYTEGLDDDTVIVRIRNATIGTTWAVAVNSTGGGTPVTDSGTVTLADFDVVLDLTGLSVGTLDVSYTEDAVEMATDTAVLQASTAGSPIGLLLILTKAA